MDLELLRTFVELEEAGTMNQAALRLHVSQASVSTRIAQLEEQLGSTLFTRNKSGSRLTTEGRAFLPHALRLLEGWEAAVRQLRDAGREQPGLELGGEFTLSTALLHHWLIVLRRERPTASLHVNVDSAERLLDAVRDGHLDVAALYSPHRRSHVQTRLILQEELVCVSTRSRARPSVEDYVFVDWGPEFAADHARLLPELSHPKTTIGFGPLALRFLLQMGGAGYFRTRAVEPYLKRGALHLAKEMPCFSYSIHAAFGSRSDRVLIDWACRCLTDSLSMVHEPWA